MTVTPTQFRWSSSFRILIPRNNAAEQHGPTSLYEREYLEIFSLHGALSHVEKSIIKQLKKGRKLSRHVPADMRKTWQLHNVLDMSEYFLFRALSPLWWLAIPQQIPIFDVPNQKDVQPNHRCKSFIYEFWCRPVNLFSSSPSFMMNHDTSYFPPLTTYVRAALWWSSLYSASKLEDCFRA